MASDREAMNNARADAIDASLASKDRRIAELEADLRDAAMLIRRLCHEPGGKKIGLAAKALDWLERKGLGPNPLRDGVTDADT